MGAGCDTLLDKTVPVFDRRGRWNVASFSGGVDRFWQRIGEEHGPGRIQDGLANDAL